MSLRAGLYVDRQQVEESVHALTGMATRARDAKPAMQAVLDVLVEAEAEQFATSGGASGRHWKADTQEWRDKKSELGKPAQPERFSGALMRSLTQKEAPQAIRSVSKQQAVIGSTVAYARFQKNPLIRVADQTDKVSRCRDIVIGWFLNGNVHGTG